MIEELVYISDIAKELSSRTSKRIKDAYFPYDHQILHLSNIAQYASIETEEGRGVKFSIAYANPDFAKNSNLTKACLFSKKRPFNRTEIVKLSPALDPIRTSIGVFEYQKEMRIWGILVHDISDYRMKRGERSSARFPFQAWEMPFLIYALDPAVLKFCIGQFEILRFIRGQIHTPCGDLFKSGGIVSNTIKQWSEFGFDGYRKYIVDWTFRKLIRSLSEADHGGTILITPTFSEKHFNLGRYGLLDYDIIKQALQARILEWESELIKFNETKPMLIGFGPIPRNRTDLSDLLEDAISTVTKLSQIDGALVLSTNLTVKAFGYGADITKFRSQDGKTF